MRKIFILILLFTTSCSQIKLFYQKSMMRNDIVDSRRELYRQSYGEIDNPEYDPE
jgi:hypothetical protein